MVVTINAAREIITYMDSPTMLMEKWRARDVHEDSKEGTVWRARQESTRYSSQRLRPGIAMSIGFFRRRGHRILATSEAAHENEPRLVL